MESIFTLLFILQVIVAVALIGFVLIQHGKGADAGAALVAGHLLLFLEVGVRQVF